ncbi:hypothetical protein [Devosia sp. SL43]|uniref:hypothetical protein n=1 Tax=Devosia sp. SL43 TaxID=2806348 RepID=UPI001F4691C1|nr:hypothetical protein [Devosia sp. SL43]UJW84483.1 hypothetical protein IM737_13725 [Devosia sp. SL43]
MNLISIGKLAATMLLAGALAGCIDAEVDVVLTSETTARATMTQVMGADFYSMVKMSASETEADAPKDDDFCADGDLTKNADGTATCVIVEEGKFARLTFGNDEPTITFASAGPGLVRVSLPTAEMRDEVGADEGIDEETKAMVEAFFKGHGITVRFSGAEVTETNMTLSEDKTSAESEIQFLDLINGTAELPDELYAVVRAP